MISPAKFSQQIESREPSKPRAETFGETLGGCLGAFFAMVALVAAGGFLIGLAWRVFRWAAGL